MSESRNKGLFLVLSGPSGVGKTSFIERVLQEYPQFQKLLSYTTRAPRANEKQGQNYNFISGKEFGEMKEEKAFVEWAEVYGDFYATGFKQVYQAWDSKKSIIKDLDIQGGRSIKKTFPHAVTIFIYPPSLFELKKRLSRRGTEGKEALDKRLTEAENEISEGQFYDFKIVNNNFEEAWLELKKIIESL